MPTYTFRNTLSKAVFEVKLSIADLDEYKTTHPELEIIIGTLDIVSGVAGTRRMDDNYRDLLKNIKKHSGRKNTINVY